MPSIAVIVDPISTGGAVAQDIYDRGILTIVVWSNECPNELKSHVPESMTVEWRAQIDESTLTVEELVAKIKDVAADAEAELVACLVGGEPGVVLADALSLSLGLRSNGIEPQRRNKSWQQKAVRCAGVRATREASGTSLDDPAVAAFLASERYPIVVKPTESAGSDGVKKCSSRDEAEEHFHRLMHAQHKLGQSGGAVICQEFLKGDEYVVDHVSRDGEHKTVMVWRYDRRACNGGDFVLFGMVPVPSHSAEAVALISYTRKVLDALGLRHGATHAEIMFTDDDGPCMVEMNCRSHGADGTWAPLARRLTGGYSQVDATADAYVDGPAFDALPSVYGAFQAAGQFVQLVNNFSGVITSVAPLEKLRALESFQHLEAAVAPGQALVPTIDLFTGLGFAILCHDDAAVVARDVAAIRAFEDAGVLVELAPPESAKSPSKKRPAPTPLVDLSSQ